MWKFAKISAKEIYWSCCSFGKCSERHELVNDLERWIYFMKIWLNFIVFQVPISRFSEKMHKTKTEIAFIASFFWFISQLPWKDRDFSENIKFCGRATEVFTQRRNLMWTKRWFTVISYVLDIFCISNGFAGTLGMLDIKVITDWFYRG